jgi:signal transduction histidine kinase
MIEDLLLLARSDNQVLPVERQSFDVRAIAWETKEIAEAMAAGRDVDVHGETGDPIHVLGDPHHTRQVLLNLAANAVRHTHRGSVIISFRRDGDMVGVALSDTGDGIPPDEVPRIFDRFYRVEKSRSRAHGGVGLGLSIARTLTELQGGRITVESTPGQGSTFVVWLPASEALPAL